MANIKINETIVSNVNLTDSGDLLGLNFVTNMTLAELETLFTPATSPEFRIVDDAENVVALYKNRKLITLRVDAGEAGNVVNLALQVTPAEIEEVELLTNQVNEQATVISEQAEQIEAQAAANDEQAAQIAEQASVIEAQATEIETLKTDLSTTQGELTETKTTLTETQTALGTTQEELAAAQETNNMLMECVLEMSEVVYA